MNPSILQILKKQWKHRFKSGKRHQSKTEQPVIIFDNTWYITPADPRGSAPINHILLHLLTQNKPQQQTTCTGFV